MDQVRKNLESVLPDHQFLFAYEKSHISEIMRRVLLWEVGIRKLFIT